MLLLLSSILLATTQAFLMREGDSDAPTETPIHCVLDNALSAETCTAECGTVPGVGNPPATHGGDECATYTCQPGDGQCPARVDCVLDTVETRKTCTAECGTVPGVGNPPASNGGDECGRFTCYPGDGECPNPTDCVVDDKASAAACTSACGMISPVVKTPAIDGGAECPSTYQCYHDDGDCSAQYIKITSGRCPDVGHDAIVEEVPCETAFKTMEGSTKGAIHFMDFVTGVPHGCFSYTTAGGTFLGYKPDLEGSTDCSVEEPCYCATRTRISEFYTKGEHNFLYYRDNEGEGLVYGPGQQSTSFEEQEAISVCKFMGMDTGGRTPYFVTSNTPDAPEEDDFKIEHMDCPENAQSLMDCEVQYVKNQGCCGHFVGGIQFDCSIIYSDWSEWEIDSYGMCMSAFDTCGVGEHGGWTSTSAERIRRAGDSYRQQQSLNGFAPCCPEDGKRPAGFYAEVDDEDEAWPCDDSSDYEVINQCEDVFNKMNAHYEERRKEEREKYGDDVRNPEVTWGGEISDQGKPHGCIRVYSDVWISVMYFNTAQDGVYTKPEDCLYCQATMMCEERGEPTMIPTAMPTDGPKKMKFTFMIDMSSEEVSQHDTHLRESIATVLGLRVQDVAIEFIDNVAARRILQTDSTKVEVKLYDITDPDATTSVINGATFASDVAADFEANTDIQVTISDVSEPEVLDRFTTESSSESEEQDVPVSAIVLPLLFCLCCCFGGYYIFQNQKKAWEVEKQTEGVHGTQAAV